MDDVTRAMYEEISRFDANYKPEMPFAPSLETLPDGEYDFEVVAATLDRTKNTNELILRLSIRALAGGVVEWPHFFKTQDSVNRAGANLVAIGADCWGKRPFSQELEDAIPKLPGVRFRANKKTDKGGYHNLFVVNRLSAGPAQQPSRPASTPRHTANATTASNEVPF